MRKLIPAAVLAAAIAVPLTAAAAPAMAGNSTQFPVQSPQDLGPAPACLDAGADLIFTVANGHHHSVTNNNGDWENSTIEGTFSTSDGAWSGHGETWFGVEGNKQATVLHLTGNGQLSDAAGDRVKIHTEGQAVVNGNGQIVVLRNIDPNTGAPLVISCS
jgi:hypothetical protein